MAVDLATLSLKLSNSQAIADAKATGAALEDMGTKGEAAQKKLVAFSNPVTEAIKKQAVTVEQSRAAWASSGGDMHKFALELERVANAGKPVPPVLAQITDSTRKMTLSQMEAIAINEKMGRGLGNVSTQATAGHLSVGRLGNQFTSLAGQIAGVHPIVGNLASIMGNFAIGTGLTLGILAGVAAIAAIWDTYTKAAREAKKANDELITSLEKDNFRAGLGPEPDLVLQTNAQRNRLMQDRDRLRVLTAFGARPDDQRIIDLNVQIKHDQDELTAGEARLFKARMDAAKPLDTVVTKARDYTAEMQKQQALLVRYNELMRQTYGSSPDGMTSAQRAEWLTSRHQSTMSDAERNEVNRSLGFPLAPDTSMPTGINVNTGLTSAQIYQRRSLGIHLQGDTNTGIAGGIEGAMSQFSPSNLAGGLVSSLLGTALKGVTGMLQDFFSNGKAAAEQAKRMAEDFSTARASFITSASGDSFGAQIAAARKALVDELRTLTDLISAFNSLNNLGLGTIAPTGGLSAQVVAAQAAEKAQEQRITQYAQEDLQVRNLRALGQGSQADLLAFQYQQAREMQAADARVQNAQTAQDRAAAELYRNTLATTQNNELLAWQNGLLATAFRNSPNGFFAGAYYSEFSTARGAAGSGPPSPTPIGNVPASGGSSHVTFNVDTIALNGNRSGDEMVNEFVGALKKRAGTMGGPNSPLSKTLDAM